MGNTTNTVTSPALNIQGMLANPQSKFVPLRSTVDIIFYATQGGPFNIRQLAGKVELDTQLQSAIIEVCSNSFYSGKNPIRQIGQAIRRLGPIGFRAVAMQAFLDLDIYYNPRWEKSSKAIKSYSLSVAHACRVIAHHISAKQDLAFLMGLLHRVGMSVPLLLLPKPEEDLLSAFKVCSALHMTHPFIAQRILKDWGMADELVEAISGYGQIFINNSPNILGAILIVAEELIQSIGIHEPMLLTTKEPMVQIDKESMEDACKILVLSSSDLPLLVQNIQEALQSSAQIL